MNVSASIESTAPDVTARDEPDQRTISAVIDALVGAGVDRKDISTTQVSLQPQYGDGDSTVIVGYQASNSIDVKIRSLDTASQTFAPHRHHRRRRHPDQLGELLRSTTIPSW